MFLNLYNLCQENPLNSWIYYGFPLSFSLMPTLLYFTDCAVEGEGETCCGTYDFEDSVFSVQRGDYAYLMEKVSQNLEKAKVDCVNHIFSVQYPSSFRTLEKCSCLLLSVFVLVHRLMLPMRTRVKCWRSI